MPDATVDKIDAQIKGKKLADSLMRLGSADNDAEHGNGLFAERAAEDLVTA